MMKLICKRAQVICSQQSAISGSFNDRTEHSLRSHRSVRGPLPGRTRDPLSSSFWIFHSSESTTLRTSGMEEEKTNISLLLLVETYKNVMCFCSS